jgi:hypothetical protein
LHWPFITHPSKEPHPPSTLSVSLSFPSVEIRGGPRTVKKLTATAKVQDAVASWEEQLALEHLDGASELRILLCRPKPSGERGSSIVAACGIYMRDILEAVPIDKYFELFKPGEGAEGGFIRISMNYLRPDQVRDPGSLLAGKKGSGGGLLPKLLLATAVLAVSGLAAKTYQDRQKSSEEKTETKPATTKGGFWGKK